MMSTRIPIRTELAPAAIGPYSQGIEVEGRRLVFVSGQVPVDPATQKLVDGGVTAQAEQVMKNIGAVLEAAGMGYADVVKATIFLTDLGEFKTVNEIYGRFFEADPPARATVQVSALPLGAAVEIECVAVG